MSSAELEVLLSHVAVVDKVAASTQSKALNAVVFLYRQVRKQDLEMDINAVRAKRSRSRNRYDYSFF